MNSRFFLFSLALVAIILISNNPRDGSREILTNKQIQATSVRAEYQTPEPRQLIASIPDPPIDLHLQSASVKNLGTNFYFLEINTDQQWPIASLTKLLTAVVALENKEADIQVIDGLVKMMMIISSNKAAERLASLKNREEFIQKMQAKAVDLAMNHTGIFDPTGLSFLNQSTVRDLEKLIGYIIKNHPKILQFSREKEIDVNGQKIANINRFAGQSNFMGGKTGYTDEASGNLISIFQYQGQPMLIIVLGTTDKLERFAQTEKLFQWISKFYN